MQLSGQFIVPPIQSLVIQSLSMMDYGQPVQELLNIGSLSNGAKVKLYALAFMAVQLLDTVAIFSRVKVNTELIQNLFLKCQSYFNTNYLFLRNVSPTVWTVSYAILYRNQLFKKIGYGLGLSSMQGREAKHIKLTKYV